MGISESNNLSGIGGVGEYFLITGHSGIENYFTTGFAVGSDGDPPENTAIFQG